MPSPLSGNENFAPDLLFINLQTHITIEICALQYDISHNLLFYSN